MRIATVAVLLIASPGALQVMPAQQAENTPPTGDSQLIHMTLSRGFMLGL